MDAELLASFLGEEVRELVRYPGGFSNLTYLVNGQWVVREPPVGSTVKGAHDMRREYELLRRLIEVYPRVPRVTGYCEAGNFYVMERVDGLILRGRPPEGIDFRRVSEETVDNLKAIHSVPGFEELGKAEGYVSRQVEGWTRRYADAQGTLPAMASVATWLAERIPAQAGACLVHNDFKYDNLVLDEDFRLRAVLDWEMATYGDPLVDLGCSLGYWVQASDPPELRALRLGLTDQPGNLTRAEVVARYGGVDDPVFYYVFGLFKLVGIAQQIYLRYQQGKTQDPRFAALGQATQVLAEWAWQRASAGDLA